MACAETPCLQKISTFIRCTVKPGTTLTLIIKDPTAVAICTHFETPGILVCQQMSERSRDLRLHPVPILLQWHHFQFIPFSVLHQATTQWHLEQNSIECCLIMICDLSLNQSSNQPGCWRSSLTHRPRKSRNSLLMKSRHIASIVL